MGAEYSGKNWAFFTKPLVVLLPRSPYLCPSPLLCLWDDEKKATTLMQNALETHLFHDSWQGLRLLPTVRHTVLFPLLPCSPLEYCFCSALSKLTFGRVRLSFLQFGDDSFCLSFYRIWQLTGKEHEDILWLSVMLSFLLTLSSVCSAQGLGCSRHPHNSHANICTFASSGSVWALLLIPSEGF